MQHRRRIYRSGRNARRDTDLVVDNMMYLNPKQERTDGRQVDRDNNNSQAFIKNRDSSSVELVTVIDRQREQFFGSSKGGHFFPLKGEAGR